MILGSAKITHILEHTTTTTSAPVAAPDNSNMVIYRFSYVNIN